MAPAVNRLWEKSLRRFDPYPWSQYSNTPRPGVRNTPGEPILKEKSVHVFRVSSNARL